MASFVSTWTGAKVGGLNLVDLFLLIALLTCSIEGALGRRRAVLTWWMLAPAIFGFLLLAHGAIFRGQELFSSGTSNAEWFVGEAALGASEGSLLFLFRLTIATTVVAFLARSEVDTHGERAGVRILAFLAVGAAASGAAALAHVTRLLPDDLLPTYRIMTERAVGLAFHPNSLALSMVVVVPVLFYFVRRDTSTGWARIGWVGALILSLVALFVADSRGAFIVGALELVLLVAISPRSPTKRLLLPGAILLPVIAVVWLPSALANTRFYSQSSGASESVEWRFAFLNASVREFLSNPISGIGLGLGSGVMVPAVIAASGGILLLVGYYTFVLTPIGEMMHCRDNQVVRHCLVSATAMIAMGFFNNSVAERFDYWTLAIGFAVGFAASTARDGGSQVTSADASPVRMR